MDFIEGLKSFLSGRRGAGELPEGTSVEGVRELVDYISTKAVPKVRLARGYGKQLGEPVVSAMAYIRELVRELGRPILLSRDNWRVDPIVNALFVSADDLSTWLESKPQLKEYAGTECCFLMTMGRREDRVLGTSVGPGAGMPRTAVTFFDHKVLALSASEEQTRRSLEMLGVRFLAEKASEIINQGQSRRMELDFHRETYKAQLHLLEMQEREESLFEDRLETTRKIAEMRDLLDGLEQERESARPRLDAYEDYLSLVRETLLRPAGHLALEKTTCRLDEFGIKVGEGAAEPSHEIAVPEFVSADRRRSAVLARLPGAS